MFMYNFKFKTVFLNSQDLMNYLMSRVLWRSNFYSFLKQLPPPYIP